MTYRTQLPLAGGPPSTVENYEHMIVCNDSASKLEGADDSFEFFCVSRHARTSYGNVLNDLLTSLASPLITSLSIQSIGPQWNLTHTDSSPFPSEKGAAQIQEEASMKAVDLKPKSLMHSLSPYQLLEPTWIDCSMSNASYLGGVSLSTL